MTLESRARDVVQQSAAEEVLTVQEFADRYRVSTQTVYSAIRTGRFKYRVERVTTSPRAPIRIILLRST